LLHDVKFEQLGADVSVAGVDSYWRVKSHGTIGLHTRLFVVVFFVASYCVPLWQVVTALHVRSECVVGATFSYDDTFRAEQFVKVLHTASEISVGGCIWYSMLPQAFKMAHLRSEVLVAATVSY
jgi:hypothetical protein